jgi:hypothetical protein
MVDEVEVRMGNLNIGITLEQRLLPLSSQPCMAQSESLTAIEIACCFIRAHVYRQYFSFVDRFIHRENVWLLQHRPVTWRRSFLKKLASPLTAFGGMLRQTLILNVICCFMPLGDYKVRFLPNGVVSQICDGLDSFLQLRSVAKWVVPYMDIPLYDRCCLLHKKKNRIVPCKLSSTAASCIKPGHDRTSAMVYYQTVLYVAIRTLAFRWGCRRPILRRRYLLIFQLAGFAAACIYDDFQKVLARAVAAALRRGVAV